MQDARGKCGMLPGAFVQERSNRRLFIWTSQFAQNVIESQQKITHLIRTFLRMLSPVNLAEASYVSDCDY